MLASISRHDLENRFVLAAQVFADSPPFGMGVAVSAGPFFGNRLGFSIKTPLYLRLHYFLGFSALPRSGSWVVELYLVSQQGQIPSFRCKAAGKTV